MELEKTTHINDLLTFYGSLLTSKQLEYMELYYADDYSLGEIAEEYEVSRQAVYDNLRRTCQILEQYEEKLSLVRDFYQRQVLYDQLETYITQRYLKDHELAHYIHQLQEMNK